MAQGSSCLVRATNTLEPHGLRIPETLRCSPSVWTSAEVSDSFPICCFNTMNMLHRDICGIKDPTKFNSEILDLDIRLHEHLQEHLRYACIHWNQHLEPIPVEHSDVKECAKEFFRTHLLHWIEVMSLLDHANHVQLALSKTKLWFQVHLLCLHQLE